MKKVSFIQFSTSEAFEQWQEDNDGAEIINVMPVVLNQTVTGTEPRNSTHKNEFTIPVYGIMVTYVKYKFGEEL